MKIVIATGEVVGLAEWIIDDTCLVLFFQLFPGAMVGRKTILDFRGRPLHPWIFLRPLRICTTETT